MNGIESLKETQIKMTEANAVSKPISNGISGHEGTGTTIITSVYFMKKEVERLKESLKQTRASNSVDLTCKCDICMIMHYFYAALTTAAGLIANLAYISFGKSTCMSRALEGIPVIFLQSPWLSLS